MKIFIFFLLIILSVSCVYALQISVSPSHIYINKLNQEVCKTVTVSSDQNINVYLEDRWSVNGKDFNDYNLSSKDFDVNINYPEIIEINDEETAEVCITANKKGTYKGVLMFKSEEGVGVGILLRVNTGENAVKESVKNNSNIGYNKINNIDKANKKSNVMLIVLLVNSLFLFVLLILVIFLVRM